jgi:hypothetical protein
MQGACGRMESAVHAIAREPIDRSTHLDNVGSCWGARHHGVESCVRGGSARWCWCHARAWQTPMRALLPNPRAPCLQLSPGPPRAWFGVPRTVRSSTVAAAAP